MKAPYALILVLLVASCSGNKQKEEPKKAFVFNSWNECSSLTALKSFVEASTEKGGKDYIPVSDRLAVFDMDGTLYGELYPTYLEYVMYQYRVLDDPDYKEKATEEQITFANEIKAGVMKDVTGVSSAIRLTR